MKKSNYSEYEAGAKTFWIIEFLSSEKNLPCSSGLPDIQFIPTVTEESDFNPKKQQLGVCVEELENEDQSEQIGDLCDSMEGACEKSVDHHKALRNHSEMINEHVENLGKIIEKFHDILREFKNKEEGRE